MAKRSSPIAEPSLGYSENVEIEKVRRATQIKRILECQEKN
jgi:hypothetical protein